MMPAKSTANRLMLLAGASLAVACLVSLAIMNIDSDQEIVSNKAELLITQLAPDGEVTTDELAIWKEIADSDSLVRLEVARQLENNKYAPLVFKSMALIGNTVIGLDHDGAMSRELAEQLICRKLEADPKASADAASLFLVLRLNPTALDSEYCAKVLTSGLATAAPGTFLQRAQLLAMVLGRLPAAQAEPFVTEIIALMNTASAADVDILFSTMQQLDSMVFARQFQSSTDTLIERIMATQSSAEIATLFEAINYLKYKIPAEQLVPILDTAVGKMLELDDRNLTNSLYITLLDLKISHPDTSFGARADYLMQGIGIYGAHYQISDYSNVLRLEEQYQATPGYEPALAAALLENIRKLGEQEYSSSIRAYCLRFLALSEVLSYEDFLPGATLLIEQLYNEQFIFQRECLHDPRLIARAQLGDRPELTTIVVNALEGLARPGYPINAGRVADQVEMLGLFGIALNADQINKVAAVITSVMQTEPDSDLLNKVGIAAAELAINFPNNFYSELFVIFANASPDSDSALEVYARARALSRVLEKLSAQQRTDLISNALGYFVTQADPAGLAEQAELLVAMESWISAEEMQLVASSLVAAIENATDMAVIPRLATVLTRIERGFVRDMRAALKPAIIRHMLTRNRRSELAALFAAVRILLLSRVDAEDNAVMTNAAVRFLNEIDSTDSFDHSLRALMKSFKLGLPASDVEQLSARFIQALAKEETFTSVGNYALSIETLALHARPGELAALLRALRQRLDVAIDAESYDVLLTTWLAVEASTNKDLPPEQRIPLYLDVLQLPLNSAESHALLVRQLEQITLQDFGSDLWKFSAWLQATERPKDVAVNTQYNADDL